MGREMKELLKDVQEIFPKAIRFSDDDGIAVNALLTIRRITGAFMLTGVGYICHSKSKSKILAVLRAIKECEK
jgi:hypothetical protein